MNILIAEDDAPTRTLLQSLLTSWGYQVTVAHDGNEAWRILSAPEHPHLAILDWVMPGLDGLEIVQRKRKEEDGDSYYFIVVTSANSENAVVEALAAGANDFVCKPFNLNELRARVAVGLRISNLQQTLVDKLRKLQEATEIISQLARTDELTGLHNRRSFREFFTQTRNAAIRHNHPLSLICVDLDHFKTVNDTLGHSEGDLVLKEFAKLMQDMVRSGDVIVRFGGEEFMILLPHTDSTAATVLAERIRVAFEQNNGNAAPLAVTASFGVAQWQGGEQEDDLIRRADAALYRAKHEGRNRVVTADSLQ